MDFDKFNREELQDIIFQCEQALYNHQQWYNSIIRSLVCKIPPDRRDISEKSYEECRFGQWYYNLLANKVNNHPGFLAMGEQHRKMHESAAKLLLKTTNAQAISPYDYDNFSNALESMRLELTIFQRELSELVYNRDSLTGAINRVSMLPLLREQQSMVNRKVQVCTIAMLDLDDFKKINDNYGHSAGDSVLAGFSRYMLENIRQYDKFFRYGGEEFLLCLQNTDVKTAFEMVERLRKGIEELKINLGDDEIISITVSCGVAPIEGELTIENSVERADAALYKAKSEGKNCTKIWSPEL